jgi:hypothetical protein
MTREQLNAYVKMAMKYEDSHYKYANKRERLRALLNNELFTKQRADGKEYYDEMIGGSYPTPNNYDYDYQKGVDSFIVRLNKCFDRDKPILFDTVHNDGGGDCLFRSVAQSVGKNENRHDDYRQQCTRVAWKAQGKDGENEEIQDMARYTGRPIVNFKKDCTFGYTRTFFWPEGDPVTRLDDDASADSEGGGEDPIYIYNYGMGHYEAIIFREDIDRQRLKTGGSSCRVKAKKV